jgi:hypothetical protein
MGYEAFCKPSDSDPPAAEMKSAVPAGPRNGADDKGKPEKTLHDLISLLALREQAEERAFEASCRATASHQFLARLDALSALVEPDGNGRLRDDLMWLIDAVDELTDPDCEPSLGWPATQDARNFGGALDLEDDTDAEAEPDDEPDPWCWWHKGWALNDYEPTLWRHVPRPASQFFAADERTRNRAVLTVIGGGA